MPATNAGVDTWSICWYLRDQSSAHRAIEALATQRVSRGKRMEEQVVDHTIGWFPASRMLYAEGHPRSDGLAQFAELVPAKEAIEAGLRDRGVLPPAYRMRPLIDFNGMALSVSGKSGFAGCRRLDVTVDIERPKSVGSAILVGAASVDPGPAFKGQVHRGIGRRIETITWSGSRSKVARIYDKGIEAGTHSAGERVRLEDQRRFVKEFRPNVEMLADGAFGRSCFERRFDPLRRATKGIMVTSEHGVVTKLESLVADGEMTPAQGAKLAGLVLLQRHGVEFGSRTTRWRNQKAVRELGLLIGDDSMEEVEIDLGAEVDIAIESIRDAP